MNNEESNGDRLIIIITIRRDTYIHTLIHIQVMSIVNTYMQAYTVGSHGHQVEPNQCQPT